MNPALQHLRDEIARLTRLANELAMDAPLTEPIQLGRWVRSRLGAKWSVVGLLMLPAGFGVAHFGPRAAVVLALSTLICTTAGILTRHLEGRAWRLLNVGTLVTGLLLGLTLSVDTPVWMIVIGALVAELVGKLPVPGLGRNLFNPAALGIRQHSQC